MPPWESDIEAAVRSPPKLRVSWTPRAECWGVEWFNGEALCVNGRKTFNAVYTEDGMETGTVERKGMRSEGADS